MSGQEAKDELLTFTECNMDRVTTEASALAEGCCKFCDSRIGWGWILCRGRCGVGTSSEELCCYLLAPGLWGGGWGWRRIGLLWDIGRGGI